MRIFLKRNKSGIDAVAEYDVDTQTVTVLSGSKVSSKIAYSATFRGAKSIEKQRENTVRDNIVMQDVQFKSLSTAANYVTGASTNGLVAWKDALGKTMREIRLEEQDNEQN